MAGRVLSDLGDRRPVSTVFVGGGTPSLVGAAPLTRLLEAVRDTGQLPAGPAIEATAALGPDVPDIRDLLGLPDVYERERRYQITT